VGVRELGVRKTILVYEGIPNSCGAKVQLGDVTVEHEFGHPIQKLVRTYRPNFEDLSCARKGVIALVLNDEAIPVIQTRIADAGH